MPNNPGTKYEKAVGHYLPVTASLMQTTMATTFIVESNL